MPSFNEWGPIPEEREVAAEETKSFPSSSGAKATFGDPGAATAEGLADAASGDKDEDENPAAEEQPAVAAALGLPLFLPNYAFVMRARAPGSFTRSQLLTGVTCTSKEGLPFAQN